MDYQTTDWLFLVITGFKLSTGEKDLQPEVPDYRQQYLSVHTQEEVNSDMV